MDPFQELYQSNLIPGYCKKENTEEYVRRSNEKSKYGYSELDGIKISRVGFGSYRIARDNPVFEKALEYSLLNGINLIDTSSNYGDGSSEALIGDILSRLIKDSSLKREEIFIVTKIGYIQGKNMKLVEEMEAKKATFSEVTYYDPNCFHCISTDFLEDQLERARKRLGLEVIDAVLLHNPEYFLMDREHHDVIEENAKTEYYRRIENAFSFLEEKRKLGIIRYYGISSNTFPKEESSYTHTSLEKVLEISKKNQEEKNNTSSGFRIIQFPANLYESGFVLEKNNISELAREKNLFTLVNRPLNAMKPKGGMDRLAIYTGKNFGIIENTLKEYKLKLESIQEKVFNSLGIENEENTFLSVIELYKDKFNSIEHFHQALNYNIIPQIKKLLARIDRLDRNRELYNPYLNILNEGIDILENYIESKVSGKMESLLTVMKAKDKVFANKTLSQIAVLSLMPYANCILVGMRKVHYVEDILPVLLSELPKVKKEELFSIEI